MTFQDVLPFPHAVIDNWLSPDAVKALHDEFPNPSDPRWQRFENGNEKKMGGVPDMWGPACQSLARVLCSTTHIRLLEEFTGIADLVPDFTGGGMHQIASGGVLGVHVDFNELRGMYRRLNFLVYLNSTWKGEWGGSLQLCAPDGQVWKEISPIGGRAVVFATSERSYHGHPEPLKTPPGVFRRSFAVYYYSPVPAEKSGSHSTVFLASAHKRA